jgi:hypothetical protein
MYNSLFAPADKKNVKGTDRINAAWLQNSPLKLLKPKPLKNYPPLNIGLIVVMMTIYRLEMQIYILH